jgi:hypothetical protein
VRLRLCQRRKTPSRRRVRSTKCAVLKVNGGKIVLVCLPRHALCHAMPLELSVVGSAANPNRTLPCSLEIHMSPIIVQYHGAPYGSRTRLFRLKSLREVWHLKAHSGKSCSVLVMAHQRPSPSFGTATSIVARQSRGDCAPPNRANSLANSRTAARTESLIGSQRDRFLRFYESAIRVVPSGRSGSDAAEQQLIGDTCLGGSPRIRPDKKEVIGRNASADLE